MSNFDGCQLQCVPKFSTGYARVHERSFIKHIKRFLALPWNKYVKKWLKWAYYKSFRWSGVSPAQIAASKFAPASPFMDGDLVRVRSREEIRATLDPFNELKGCAFLLTMYPYCDTQQRIFRSMHSFLDERDYKLKKVRGVILLENIICNGDAAFGQCDRCCFLFWREEWLEKITG